MFKTSFFSLSVATMTLLTTACVPIPSSGICTMNYVSVIAQVKTDNDIPVALDSYRIISQKNGSNIGMFTDFSSEAYRQMQKSGYYLIVDDSQVGQLTNKKLDAKFIGYKNGKEIINEELVVGADSCHVFSEPRNLTFIYTP